MKSIPFEKSNELSTKIKCILNFFDIFGYNSSVSTLSNRQAVAYFIYAVHILIAISYTLYQIRLWFLLEEMPLLEILNSMLQYSIALYTYWFVILDSIIYREKHKLFWKIFQKLDTTHLHHFKTTIFWSVLKMFGYFCSTTFCITLIIFVTIYPVNDSMYVHNILIKLCEVRIFYYTFCLEIVNIQLKTIESELISGKRRTRSWLDSNQFKWIRIYFECVHDMTNLINELFGFSHVLNISCCFYVILTDMNYVVIRLHGLPTIAAISKNTFQLP